MIEHKIVNKSQNLSKLIINSNKNKTQVTTFISTI